MACSPLFFFFFFFFFQTTLAVVSGTHGESRVPHFPIEDEKLRAKKITRRRGGNTANTLEVLTQLLGHDARPINLHLLCVLPDKSSTATQFIRDSLPLVDIDEPSLFRQGHQDAASSYIIQNQESLSRTIVSINELPEMTDMEFVNKVKEHAATWGMSWFHFEGRIPHVTVPCIQFLQSSFLDIKISVECEKPERAGMAEAAGAADVVFYSKLWAERSGYADARGFLQEQCKGMREGRLLCCTWGAGGATAVQKKGKEWAWAQVQAWHPESGDEDGKAVDTIGAGDTFIAGMLYAINTHDDWDLQRKLEFSNQLAGRKVLQEGFDGLGRKMLQLV